MSNPNSYKEVLADLAAGKTVTDARFDAAVEFAKSTKRKRPVRPAVEAKPGKKAVAKKAASTRATNAGKSCAEADCDSPAMAKGLCSRHYTAMLRKDPAVMLKAREASKRYAEKKRAEKLAAEAKAAKGAK